MTSTSSDVSDAHIYYNKPQEHNIKQRNESEILYMRNFNNWIKSTLINEYLQRIRNEQPERKNDIHVFDMGCGKGGDQLKWQSGNVKFVTFADLAENSVEVCKERYNQRKRKCGYDADFYPLDCTKELIRDKLKTAEPCFDLVSSQFVLHYSFDKYESADRFLRNAAELLRVDGYFIGTTVNACQLVKKCRASDDQSISNDVFKIQFDSSIDLNSKNGELIPLFGAKYHFTLADVVDCPEYLVHFPLLKKLAKKHGLELIDRQTFKDYFDKNKDTKESRSLFQIIKALERYEPPADGSNHSKGPPIDHSQYTHTQKYFDEKTKEHSDPPLSCRTLSKKEWDITSLYIIFVFKKVQEIKYDEDNIVN